MAELLDNSTERDAPAAVFGQTDHSAATPETQPPSRPGHDAGRLKRIINVNNTDTQISAGGHTFDGLGNHTRRTETLGRRIPAVPRQDRDACRRSEDGRRADCALH